MAKTNLPPRNKGVDKIGAPGLVAWMVHSVAAQEHDNLLIHEPQPRLAVIREPDAPHGYDCEEVTESIVIELC